MPFPKKTIITDSAGNIRCIINIPDTWPDQTIVPPVLRRVLADGTVQTESVVDIDSKIYTFDDLDGDDLAELQRDCVKTSIREIANKPVFDLEIAPGQKIRSPVESRRRIRRGQPA